MQEVYTEFKNTPAEFKMIYVEGGVFEMGSNDETTLQDEKSVVTCKVKPFWVGEFLVTQSLWKFITDEPHKETAYSFTGKHFPVESVSLEDIETNFLPKLNGMIKDKYPKNMKYRLPTEVEWEFVARGGKYSNKYPFKYSGSDKLEEVGWFGWFDENIYGKRTQGELKDVALKTPNLLGVYDMSGSVWEWCQNNIIGNITSNHTTIGSCKEPDSTEYSAYRGGSWLSSHLECTPFSRMKAKANSMNYMLGFRLAFS